MERRFGKLLLEAVGRVQQFIWVFLILRENSFIGRYEIIVLLFDDILCIIYLFG